jgi:hypothetical protein
MVKSAFKTIIYQRLFITIILITIILAFNSCRDDEPEPQPKSQVELFAGSSSKTWGIEELYVNDTMIELSADQLLYTKTYKRDNSFVDNDGFQGTWLLDIGGSTLREDITIGGTGSLTYKIEALTESSLHLRLTNDGTQTLNTLYQFRAK